MVPFTRAPKWIPFLTHSHLLLEPCPARPCAEGVSGWLRHRGGPPEAQLPRRGLVAGWRILTERPPPPFSVSAVSRCGSKPMVRFWGRCTTHFRTSFSWDWDVHRGYGLLTHSLKGKPGGARKGGGGSLFPRGKSLPPGARTRFPAQGV